MSECLLRLDKKRYYERERERERERETWKRSNIDSEWKKEREKKNR